jgi:hypothetical protein
MPMKSGIPGKCPKSLPELSGAAIGIYNDTWYTKVELMRPQDCDL